MVDFAAVVAGVKVAGAIADVGKAARSLNVSEIDDLNRLRNTGLAGPTKNWDDYLTAENAIQDKVNLESGKYHANIGGNVGTKVDALVDSGEKSTDNAARNAASYAGLKLDLKAIEAANSIVDSLRATGQLPSNYVIKVQAAQQGWQSGKALNNSVPSGQMGGDVFANSTNVFPSSAGRARLKRMSGLPVLHLVVISQGQLC